jgi:periplasmic protein TonB
MSRTTSGGPLSRPTRLSLAVIASGAFDVAIVALLFLASRGQPARVKASTAFDAADDKRIVWLSDPGPGGGGGGGGNRMKEPPRQAEAPGHDAITVPVQRPPSIAASQPLTNAPVPIEQLLIPAKDLSASQNLVPGTIEPPAAPPSISQGPGSRDGAGTGDGTGDGPGRGPGRGPGTGGGFGGDAFQPGSDVMRPVLLREVKPAYTSDAMRAHLQGSVFLWCVVNRDGSVGEVKILRSLDPTFGLDLEAIKAARQWRFRPGTRRGEPVPVLITIQLDFSLR